jgi:hypothetical protein
VGDTKWSKAQRLATTSQNAALCNFAGAANNAFQTVQHSPINTPKSPYPRGLPLERLLQPLTFHALVVSAGFGQMHPLVHVSFEGHIAARQQVGHFAVL